MNGLRNRKNKLRNAIYDMRDELISGIEDKVIDERKVKLLHEKILDLFQEFQDVCNDLHGKWEVYKEIDKQARLHAEYDQVKTAVDEATKLVGEYEDFLRKQQASLHAHEQEVKPRLSKEREPVGANVNQQINELISQLENSLADIG